MVSHSWVKGSKMLKEDPLPDLKMKHETDLDDHSGEYLCIFLPKHVGKTSIEVKGLPNIKAVKKSEIPLRGVLGLHVGLLLPGQQLGVVQDGKLQAISNSSQSKFFMVFLETGIAGSCTSGT